MENNNSPTTTQDFARFVILMKQKEPGTTFIHKCVIGQHVIELQLFTDDGWLLRDVDYDVITFILQDFDAFYDEQLDPTLEHHVPDPKFKPMWAGSLAAEGGE